MASELAQQEAFTLGHEDYLLPQEYFDGSVLQENLLNFLSLKHLDFLLFCQLQVLLDLIYIGYNKTTLIITADMPAFHIVWTHLTTNIIIEEPVCFFLLLFMNS